MKYFNNIYTAEELKKKFRAYCVSMHPDKGGAPEEFKAMMAEYNGIIKNFEQAKEEARNPPPRPADRQAWSSTTAGRNYSFNNFKN